jgi:hypothetical protein
VERRNAAKLVEVPSRVAAGALTLRLALPYATKKLVALLAVLA